MLKVKKMLSIILLISVITSVNVACSAKPTSTSGSKAITDVSLLIYDRGIIPASEGTLTNNWFTKEFNKRTEAKLGIKVNFISVPNEQREQKLATLLAGGEAPDLCYSYDETMIQNYSRNGGLTDLSSLVDKEGPNIIKLAGTTLEQGKIDGKLTRIYSAMNPVANPTWIRTDWLKALGMKAPTNIDEFYTYLKAVKEKDPGKVGDSLMPFVLPVSGAAPFGFLDCNILAGFIKTAPTIERIATVPYQLWPETKDMYKFLNKLYNEKLLGQLVVDTDQSQYRQMLSKGDVGSTINFLKYNYDSATGNILENLQKNVPGSDYTGTYPWKDPSAKDTIYNLFSNGVSSMTWFVPKSCKNPAAAVKLLNYMGSDDYINLVSSGIEGTDYKVVNGINIPINSAKFETHNSWTWGTYNALAPLYVTDTTKFLKSSSIIYKPAFAADYVKYAIIGKPATMYATPIINLPTPISDKDSANLNTEWGMSSAKIIMCSENDFNKTFDDNLKAWRSDGGDAVAKEMADLYKQQYGK